MQASSKTALSVSQNIVVNSVPSNGITSAAVIIPIAALNPPSEARTQANIAITCLLLNYQVGFILMQNYYIINIC